MATERGRLLEELTWPAVAALIDEGHDLALLPVGATEQHGRHLPLSTDSEIAAAVCREASRQTGVPVLPTVQIGSSGAHTEKRPGTLSLPRRERGRVEDRSGGSTRAGRAADRTR